MTITSRYPCCGTAPRCIRLLSKINTVPLSPSNTLSLFLINSGVTKLCYFTLSSGEQEMKPSLTSLFVAE